MTPAVAADAMPHPLEGYGVTPGGAGKPECVVTSLADSGSGSLRNAIASAAYGDVITFHPDLAGQTITLASTLGIGKGLTIDGSGLEPRVEISGNGTVQIFGVNPRLDPSGPPDVKFKSLVLKDGRRAIGIGGGNTLIENVSFINNSAYDGGAISGRFLKFLNRNLECCAG